MGAGGRGRRGGKAPASAVRRESGARWRHVAQSSVDERRAAARAPAVPLALRPDLRLRLRRTLVLTTYYDLPLLLRLRHVGPGGTRGVQNLVTY